MHRIIPYSLLFVTVLLSQLLLFDNLNISIMLSPLVYITFIALLPTETKQLWMLVLGIAVGVVMDITMGTEGLNSIATIFIAFVRRPILRVLFLEKPHIGERGVPSRHYFGNLLYLRYLAIIVVVHHFIFFGFEALSIVNLQYMAIRTVASSAVTIIYAWLLSQLFTSRNYLR